MSINMKMLSKEINSVIAKYTIKCKYDNKEYEDILEKLVYSIDTAEKIIDHLDCTVTQIKNIVYESKKILFDGYTKIHDFHCENCNDNAYIIISENIKDFEIELKCKNCNKKYTVDVKTGKFCTKKYPGSESGSDEE